MIELTGQKEYYRSSIFEKYRANYSDIHDWDQRQLFRLMEEFAKQGDAEARGEVLYYFERKFETAEEYLNGWHIGSETIIAADGIPGLLHVVERFGQWIKEERDIIFPLCLIDEAEKILGKSEVETALQEASRQNEFIRIYLDRLKAYRESSDAEDAKRRNESNEERGERVREEYPLRKMTDHFLNNDFSKYADDERFLENPYRFLRYHTNYKFSIGGRWAAEEDLNYVYEKIMEQDDPLRKAILLWTFYSSSLPKVDEQFLALLDSDDERLAQSAKNTLSNTKSPLVREKALELLTTVPTPPNWAFGIDLMESNFQEEDFDLLDSAIRTKRFSDEWDLEFAGISIRKIYDQHPSEKFAEIFLWFYENGPCSFCRKSFIDCLQKMQRLPHEILEECRDDCNSEIRKLARSALQ